MILNLSLLLIIVVLLIFLSMIWPPDSPWTPWWRTSDDAIRKAYKLANVKSSDIVYDLGSGDGRSLIIAAKEFGAYAIGIEIDPLRFFMSKLYVMLSGLGNKVEIRRENFLQSDFSDATVIFAYLVPKALQRLLPKFNKELRKDVRIVSIKYEMDLPIFKEIPYLDKYIIRLYRLPQK